MQVMVIIHAGEASEAGRMPGIDYLNAMGRFNAELVEAGVLVSAAGLKPSKTGVRISFDPSGGQKVVDGPFAESKELVGGFWILEVPGYDDAVAWARRVPQEPGVPLSLEVRAVTTAEDFAEMTPEMAAAEQRLEERSGQPRGS